LRPAAGRIGDHQPHLLSRVDDENGAHREDVADSPDGSCHKVPQLCDPIRDDGEIQSTALSFLDIFRPLLVRVRLIHAEADYFDIALVKFRLQREASPSSVVQTGVKSWDERTIQPTVADPIIEN